MIIDTLVLGALSTNCYLVYDEITHEGIIIDPADEAIFIAEKIQRLNIDLKAIIATHGHFDHNLAAGELQLIFPTVPYYIHEKDVFLLKQINQSATHWLKIKESRPIPFNIQFLINKKFQASSFKFQVLPTPGHTPGSICCYIQYLILDTKYSILFTGDTLFKGAVGRTDLSYSDPKALAHSLDKLFKLPDDTLVYPGHGEMTTIGHEAHNMKLET